MSTTPPPVPPPPDIALQRMAAFAEHVSVSQKRIAEATERMSANTVAAFARIDAQDHEICSIKDRLREGGERFASIDVRFSKIDERLEKTEERTNMTTQRFEKLMTILEERERSNSLGRQWVQWVIPLILSSGGSVLAMAVLQKLSH